MNGEQSGDVEEPTTAGSIVAASADEERQSIPAAAAGLSTEQRDELRARFDRWLDAVAAGQIAPEGVPTDVVEIDIYQGDDPDALRNVHVGHFTVEGLTKIEGPNTVMCRMRLDVDGILHVTAIEKRSGMSKHVAIAGATRQRTGTELARSRKMLDELYGIGNVVAEPDGLVAPVADADVPAAPTDDGTDEAAQLVRRCREAMASLHADDQEEALGLIEAVEDARKAGDEPAVASATSALREFLFFVEGR